MSATLPWFPKQIHTPPQSPFPPILIPSTRRLKMTPYLFVRAETGSDRRLQFELAGFLRRGRFLHRQAARRV